MKTTTKFIINTVMILCITLIIAAIPTEKESAIYDDTIRLHILANSDGEIDQSVKLKIRDKVLDKYSTKLQKSRTKSEAVEVIKDLEDSIEYDVEAWLSEMGEAYGADVVIGSEWYDTRVYDSFTLPCGYYTSLRILLGEGEGQNWWCVMYPPLCLDTATATPSEDAPSYTDEESALIIGGEYNVKFKVLELLSETFRDFSKNG